MQTGEECKDKSFTLVDFFFPIVSSLVDCLSFFLPFVGSLVDFLKLFPRLLIVFLYLFSLLARLLIFIIPSVVDCLSFFLSFIGSLVDFFSLFPRLLIATYFFPFCCFLVYHLIKEIGTVRRVFEESGSPNDRVSGSLIRSPSHPGSRSHTTLVTSQLLQTLDVWTIY